MVAKSTKIDLEQDVETDTGFDLAGAAGRAHFGLCGGLGSGDSSMLQPTRYTNVFDLT